MSPLVVPQDTPGPMCRTVKDAASMFNALVGFDPKDDYTAANTIAGSPRGGNYASGLDKAQASDLRVGVIGELFGPDSDPEMAPVNSCVRSALSRLKDAGAKVVEGITIPRLKAHVGETSLYQTRSQNDIDNFLKTNTHSDLSHLSVQSIHEASAYHPALDLFKLIASGPKSPHDDPDFAKKLLAQPAFQRVVLSVMAEKEVDILAFPDCKIAAPKLEDVESGRWGIYDFPTNTMLASHAMLPAVSVPVGFTDIQSGDNDGAVGGLPVGVEMVGCPYSEQRLLEAAAVVERVVGGRSPPLKL